MILSGKRALVTGADGFIGSHLAEALLARGCRVRSFVYYNSFNSWGWLDSLSPEVLASMEVVTGDVRDPQIVRDATRGCDIVFHLAALVAIPYSYHSPASYVDTNIGGTLNVLQAARELGVERVVHTSTSETYGTARYVPIDEEHPLQGQSPYAATKIGADQMALAFQRSFGTPVTVLRPFNTYGPRQSARAVIPAIITQIAAGREVVQLGALHPTRDFTYVSDTVAGFIAAAEADEAVGQVINVGSGFEISIGATAELIAAIMGREIELVCDTERLRPEASEVERLWASTEKACRLLGWSPAYGGKDGLRKGLEATVAWFSRPENIKLYKPDVYHL